MDLINTCAQLAPALYEILSLKNVIQNRNSQMMSKQMRRSFFSNIIIFFKEANSIKSVNRISCGFTESFFKKED